MSFKQWVFVLCLLVSLRPLSKLIPLLAPSLQQGISVMSEMSQGTGEADSGKPTKPQRQPQEGVQQGEQQQVQSQSQQGEQKSQQGGQQSQSQSGTQTDGMQPDASVVSPATPETSGEAYRWRPTADDRLGLMLNEALVVQIVEPLSPAEAAGLNSGDKLLTVNGKPLRRASDLKAVLSKKPASVVLRVQVFIHEPGQAIQDITVKLTPDSTAAL